MNTFSLTVLPLLASLGISYAQLDFVAVNAAYTLCAAETGGIESFDDVVKNDVMPTSDKGKCLVECTLKKLGLHKQEGGYSHAGTRSYLSKVLLVQSILNPSIVDKAMKVCDDCGKIDVTGLNSCEAATKMYECSIQGFKSQNIKVK